MTIITLTTDFGVQDYYAAALKGALLRNAPGAQLVDITHQINPFDILQAAWVVRNAWADFPSGTIHIVGVHCVYDQDSRFAVLRRDGHYFLAPDNGLLTLLFQDIDANDARILPVLEPKHFAAKDIFAAAAAHLSAGGDFESLGLGGEHLLQRISLQPVIMPSRIRGSVVHIDNFENAVVNIRRDVFDKVGEGRSFSLFFKRNDPISKLSDNYCDVPPGEQLCLFNSAGFLEIAVNMGKAATLMGLKVEEVVEVVFEEKE